MSTCFANSISSSMLSLLTTDQVATATDIMFYVNLGLMFFALVELTAFTVLCKKTSCAYVAGLASAILFVFGLIVFIVQLVLYAYGHVHTVYAVYICLAVLACGFIVGGVYCIMLSRNACKSLCIAAGVLQIIPPVGAALAVWLSYKIKRDTRAQELVFNGYAYTYAALGAFCASNTTGFVDMSGEESFEPLHGRGLKRKLKALKKAAVNAEGQYKYAAALITYTPVKYKKAVKLISRAAADGYAPAQFNLGYYYETGLYVKKDYKRAREYYNKAAALGDSDAALRLGILSVAEGNHDDGIRIFKARADEHNDLCAKYNIGMCYECGYGVDADVDKAVEIYTECANAGLFAAQKRIFSIASTDMNSPQNGKFFRSVTDRKFDGSFAVMIDGLIQIKKRLAADASEYFKTVVLMHDKWEGVARCILGTLYIDCGKYPQDRKHGVQYVKSACGLWDGAKDIYATIPRSVAVKGKNPFPDKNSDKE